VVLQRFDNGLAMQNRGFGFNGAINKKMSADSSHTGFIFVNFVEFLDNTADGDNQDIGAFPNTGHFYIFLRHVFVFAWEGGGHGLFSMFGGYPSARVE